jgi:nicotinate-nucleotide adenylyltransferase
VSDFVASRKQRIAILGGTFDPPHLGHLIIAERIRDQFQIDHVIWVPGHIPPHKRNHALTSADARMAMVELAIADNSSFAVSDLEIARGGVSYTVDTLEELAGKNPNSDLHLIVGGDSFMAFDTWREPERIRQIANLIVYNRKDSDYRTRLPDNDRLLFADGPIIEISSSMVRRAVQSGRSIRYLVPERVRAYIEENRLYT